MMDKQLLPDAPETMPRMSSKRRLKLVKWVGRNLLKVLGWKVEGKFPHESKLIIAAAPHTSNWDFLLAMLAVMAYGLKISFLMKKEAFYWPFKNLFMALGGIPLDRSATEDIVDQITSWYNCHEKLWVVITPEGTRSKVGKWKTGFLRVAEQADIPVLLVAWDYPTKTLHIDKIWDTTGNYDQDVEDIRCYINNKYTGKFPKWQ